MKIRTLHRYCPACQRPIRPGQATVVVTTPGGEVEMHSRCMGGGGPRPEPPDGGTPQAVAA